MCILGGFLAGSILLFPAAIRIGGVILICVTVGAALPYIAGIVRTRTVHGTPGGSAERVAALVAGVFVGLLVLEAAASIVRSNDSYYRSYGTAVPAYAVGASARATEDMDVFGAVVALGEIDTPLLAVPFPLARAAWIALLVRRRRGPGQREIR